MNWLGVLADGACQMIVIVAIGRRVVVSDPTVTVPPQVVQLAGKPDTAALVTRPCQVVIVALGSDTVLLFHMSEMISSAISEARMRFSASVEICTARACIPTSPKTANEKISIDTITSISVNPLCAAPLLLKILL